LVHEYQEVEEEREGEDEKGNKEERGHLVWKEKILAHSTSAGSIREA